MKNVDNSSFNYCQNYSVIYFVGSMLIDSLNKEVLIRIELECGTFSSPALINSRQ